MKKIVLFFCLLLNIKPVFAHVGSPGVTFEGNAGPYKLTASINPPDVIPGTATAAIYLDNSPANVQISVKPIYWFAGADGSPRADVAERSLTEAGRYDVKLWMMSMGASSVEITVKGPAGTGKVLVPVMAVSTARRTMPGGLSYGLLAMAVFLVVLMVTIVSASISDSMLDPGEALDKRLRRRAITGGAAALVMLMLILWGGKTWWDAAAKSYTRYMYQPLQATTVANMHNGTLTMVIDTAALNNMNRKRFMNVTRKLNYLIPDHGKLMHLFLIRAGSLDVFAHLHPRRLDSVTFVTAMPKIPAGKYWVYADITRLSGFSETIVDTLEVKDQVFRLTGNNTSSSSLSPDRDDTYYTTNAINSTKLPLRAQAIMCGSPGVETKLADGSSAVWIQEPGKVLKAGELNVLKFEILDENRQPAALQPYLGMMAHAVILREDGSVYIHLHPAGSYSMGSQKALLDRIAFHQPLNKYLPQPTVFADSINRFVAKLDHMDDTERDKILMAGMNHTSPGDAHAAHQVSFPYTFPQPGKYRIWLQTKRNGKILNSAFDAVVN